MRAAVSFAAVVALSFASASSAAPDLTARFSEPSRVERVANAVTEIDLARAEKLLAEAGSESTALSFERARLSVYRGDCAVAAVTLSRPELLETKEGMGLRSLQSRIHAMNGKLEVESSGQSGVSAYLEFEIPDLKKESLQEA